MSSRATYNYIYIYIDIVRDAVRYMPGRSMNKALPYFNRRSKNPMYTKTPTTIYVLCVKTSTIMWYYNIYYMNVRGACEVGNAVRGILTASVLRGASLRGVCPIKDDVA